MTAFPYYSTTVAHQVRAIRWPQVNPSLTQSAYSYLWFILPICFYLLSVALWDFSRRMPNQSCAKAHPPDTAVVYSSNEIKVRENRCLGESQGIRRSTQRTIRPFSSSHLFHALDPSVAKVSLQQFCDPTSTKQLCSPNAPPQLRCEPPSYSTGRVSCPFSYIRIPPF